ncbi:crossover junction endodeoxyribonuclease RuvC, partial [bacterium]|nr:crossover junction endodeoxyribonuclease RuvC [bacterium]
MRVLGIDPGTAVTGYGVVEEVGSSLKFIASGAITTSSKGPFSNRLGQIFQRISELINDFKPDSMAVEEPFLAKNVRMALRIGQARGVAVLAAVQAKLEVASYMPLQVKQAIVGYGRAEK